MLKGMRYIVGTILIAIVFFFIGELYVFHVNNFESEYTDITMYLQRETTHDEMITDIITSAKKNNVEVFTIDRTVDNILSVNFDIYGTDGVEEYLTKHSEVMTGKFNSFLLGELNVRHHAFEKIEDISKFNMYELIGDEKDILQFRQDLINKYAGRFPQKGGTPEAFSNVIIVWSIVFVLLILMTGYEVALRKKEVMVKVILGERLRRVVLRGIVSDTVIFTVVFSGIMLLLNTYTNATFYQTVSWLSFGVFLFFNALIHTSLFFTNYKQDLASKQKAKQVLKFGYIYKMISVVLVILVMAGSIKLIDAGINYYRQRDFFREHKSYSYVMISGETSEQERELISAFNQQMQSQGQVLMLALVPGFVEEDKKEYIFADRGSLSYLKKNIPELQEKELQDKMYLLIPKKDAINEAIITNMQEIMESYYNASYEWEVIPYNGRANILNIGRDFNLVSSLKKNPLIILNNMELEDVTDYESLLYPLQFTMYDVSDEEWNSFIQERGLDQAKERGEANYYKTNVYDYYMHGWQFAKRNTVIALVLFGILLVLEGIIIRTLLHYEYTVNATEIALKKILGSTLLQRNKKLLLVTGILGFLSLIIAVVVSYFLGWSSSIMYILIGGVFILSVELLFIIFSIRKMENVNIQKILKGGSL